MRRNGSPPKSTPEPFRPQRTPCITPYGWPNSPRCATCWMLLKPSAEIRPHFRSVTFGNYVIFLRYSDEDGPRSHLYVTRILWGSRDLDAYFRRALDDNGIE